MRGRYRHGLDSVNVRAGRGPEILKPDGLLSDAHVRVLESAGLLRRRVEGRSHLCRLNPRPLASAHAWLGFYEQFWSERLDTLEALLNAEDAAAARTRKKGTRHDSNEK
jgi:hypothetical protein